ncbi:hypothetical protein [Shewanella maritima]|uniref:hypothetical protein n=1 Tax=Shewanella maritima TaxID=2520507 RepID=UPI0037366243
MKKLLLAACILGLTACASTDKTEAPIGPEPVPTSIALGEMSNEQASYALYNTLVKSNYLVDKIGANRIAIQFGDQEFVLEVSRNQDGIDRILANRFYAVHPQLHGSQELLLAIGSLNQKLNFAKFLVRENGAVIQVQSSMTFVNGFELEELRRFMLWTDEGLRQVGDSFPERSQELIKPLPIMQHPTSE